MLFNFLITALRIMKKHRLSSFITTAGLGIGLALYFAYGYGHSRLRHPEKPIQ